jgi:CRISPR-associated exonuclease Cas4
MNLTCEDAVSIPLSALEHVAYCRRQAALIHIEATWTDNVHTVHGELAHRVVDLPGVRRRGGMRSVRGLPVYSSRHGLHGVCDLVEITGNTAVPVEYKVGRYQAGGPAEVQLAGQAVCLREAGYAVDVGYIYSAADRRRHGVPITDELVARMLAAADEMRGLLGHTQLPSARNDRRCRRCSLREDCLPELTHSRTHETGLFTAKPLGAW